MLRECRAGATASGGGEIFAAPLTSRAQWGIWVPKLESDSVMPAQAGIHATFVLSAPFMDPSLRWGDEKKS